MSVCPHCDAEFRIPPRASHAACPACHAEVGILHGVPIRMPEPAAPSWFARGAAGAAGLASLAGIYAVVAAFSFAVTVWVCMPRSQARVHAPVPVVGPAPAVRPAPVVGPVPAFQMPTNPDYLHDAELMRALPGEMRRILETDGRFYLLTIGAEGYVVGQLEVPEGVDSLVLSFGQQVKSTVSMSAEDHAKLPERLFELDGTRLARLPARLERELASRPDGTTVNNVTLHALAGPAQVMVSFTHPRVEQPPSMFSLADL